MVERSIMSKPQITIREPFYDGSHKTYGFDGTSAEE